MKLTEENGEERKAPPIGVPPLFILIEHRINDLTETIQRYNNDTSNYKIIGDMAFEIMVLADAGRKVTERRREK